MNIKLAPNLSLPVDVVTQAIAVLAKRGVGKSYLSRRFTEQLHRAGQQVVVLDPKGDWWGIRSAADGKAAGLPFVIFGGERGDVPLEVGAGELVAKLMVEERVSALIDLSLFRKHEVATFATAFLEALYRLKSLERNRTPLMLVVDEADALAPQKPQPNEARMVGAMSDIVRRGRQRGLGCLMITQRSAVLSKDILTQVEVLVTLRTIAPQDLGAVDAWVDVHGTTEQRKTLKESLPALPVGDAWVWSPGWPTSDGIFKRVHVLPIETFDSGATPKPGERRVEPRTLADVDLEAVRRQMADTLERAKAEDPKALRAEVARLRQEIHRAANAAPAPPACTELHVHPLLPGALKKIEDALDGVRSGIGAAERTLNEVAVEVVHARRWTTDPMRPGSSTFGPSGSSTATPGPTKSPSQAPRTRPTHDATVGFGPEAARGNGKASGHAAAASAPAAPADGEPVELGAGERKVLNAVAQCPGGCARKQLSVFVGFKKSYRDLCIQRLKRWGFVAEEAGQLRATDAGIAELGGSFEPLPTGKALREYWMARLPEGERRVLDVVCCAYPHDMGKDDISGATGYKRSTRDLYVQLLARRKLVAVQRGRVRASEALFS